MAVRSHEDAQARGFREHGHSSSTTSQASAYFSQPVSAEATVAEKENIPCPEKVAVPSITWAHPVAGVVSTGVVTTGFVSTGVVTTGVVSTGVVSTGDVTTGFVSAGVVSAGFVSGGVVSPGAVSKDCPQATTNKAPTRAIRSGRRMTER